MGEHDHLRSYCRDHISLQSCHFTISSFPGLFRAHFVCVSRQTVSTSQLEDKFKAPCRPYVCNVGYHKSMDHQKQTRFRDMDARFIKCWGWLPSRKCPCRWKFFSTTEIKHWNLEDCSWKGKTNSSGERHRMALMERKRWNIRTDDDRLYYTSPVCICCKNTQTDTSILVSHENDKDIACCACDGTEYSNSFHPWISFPEKNVTVRVHDPHFDHLL